MRISRNFHADELTVSEHHPELVIPFEDLPMPVAVNLVRGVYLFLQPLRDVVGPVATTSGHRGPALNAAVGGSDTSRHPFGLAFDFYTPNRAAIEVFMLLAAGQTHATFDRLCLYPQKNRLHVDLGEVEDGPPRRLFYIDRGRGWQPLSESEAVGLVS